MLLEAANSVFITFVATEYLLLANDNENNNASARRSPSGLLQLSSRPTIRCALAVVMLANAFVRYHDAGAALADWAHRRVEGLFHVPRVAVAMLSFLVALYWDCRQKHRRSAKNQPCPAPWSNGYFLKQLARSFCRLLPVYPFLAVIISFGFLFVISAFEKLHLPLQVLNMPIYYGTLYG